MAFLVLAATGWASFRAEAQAPRFEWVMTAPYDGPDARQITRLAADSSGNCLAAGLFRGTQDLGGRVLTSSGANDVFLAKYTPSGDLLWAQQAGSTNDDQLTHLGVDAAGNIYLGYELGGTNGPFITKYNAAGNLLWTREGMFPGEFFGDLCVGPEDSLYLTGAAISGYEQVMSLAKYDGEAHRLWVTTGTPTGTVDAGPWGRRLAVDGQGNCYVVGTFYLEALIGGTHLYATGQNGNCFVAKYDPLGNPLWAHQLDSPDPPYPYVGVDAQGNCYLAGIFGSQGNYPTLTCDGLIVSTAGNYDMFVAKYGLDGNINWLKEAGGTGVDQCRSLVVDASGLTYVTGMFGAVDGGPATFGDTTVASAGVGDALIGCYASDGSVQWVKTAGGAAYDGGDAIAVGTHGELYVSGFVGGQGSGIPAGGTANFDNLVAQGDARLSFLTKLLIPMPTPRPKLQLSLSASGQLILSWSTNYAGFVLESAAQSPAVAWDGVSNPVGVEGTDFVVGIDPSQPAQFYRLRGP